MLKLNNLSIVTVANENDYLNIDEASRFLGISNGSLRNYLSWGWLTTYKFKTLTLLKREELEDWIKYKKRQ